jgi:hypothetical protein
MEESMGLVFTMRLKMVIVVVVVDGCLNLEEKQI